MGMTAGERRVSLPAASRPLAANAAPPRARPVRRRGRGPPPRAARTPTEPVQPAAGVQGRNPRAQATKKGEAMRQHRLSQEPDSRS
jgi:hypothetical protein